MGDLKLEAFLLRSLCNRHHSMSRPDLFAIGLVRCRLSSFNITPNGSTLVPWSCLLLSIETWTALPTIGVCTSRRERAPKETTNIRNYSTARRILRHRAWNSYIYGSTCAAKVFKLS